MKQFLNILGWVVLCVLFVDFIGFMAWGLSGQFPSDGYFVGAITKGLISIFL